MRIISINVHYQDKLGYQDYFLGKELMQMGHEIHFVSSDVHFDFPDYEHTVQHIIGDKYVGTGVFFNDYGAKVHRLKSKLKKITGLIWLVGFKKKINEIKPDLIISHGILTWQTIRLVFYDDIKCPIIFDDHTTINLVRKDKFSLILYFLFRKLLSKRIYERASHIVGISSSCIDVINKNFGLQGSKIKMIPLGTDTDIYYPSDDLRNLFRKKNGIKDGDCLIVYTGKMYDKKNAHLILDAIDDETLTKNEIVALFVGDFSVEYQEFFYKKMEETKFPVMVKKAVTVEELASIYNAADICVWPDHLTTSTIDASACGTPIICSDYMPERVKYGNGFLVKAGCLVDLKEKLSYLINNKSLRLKMGAKGVEYVKNELSWKVITKKMIDI